MDTCSGREVTSAMRDKRTGFAVLGKKINDRTKLLPTDGERIPIPTAESLLTQFMDKSTDEWASRIRTCPITGNNFSVIDLHLRMSKVFPARIAWQLVWGFAVVKFGEPSVPTWISGISWP